MFHAFLCLFLLIHFDAAWYWWIMAIVCSAGELALLINNRHV